MEYVSIFVSLALLSPCVSGYLIIMEGQCANGQEPCFAGQEIQPVLKNRIDSLEAQVAKLQEIIERHINNSVTGSCPDGFMRHNDSCYYIDFEETLTFTEAVRFCWQHRKSHVIHVQSDAENTFIVDILRKQSAGFSWIGLTDMAVEGNWIGYDTGEKPSYTNWCPGEPQGKNVENCAGIARHTNYTWHDFSCTLLMHPICETSAYNEKIVS